ncbi:ankyrin repeat domain-containing protein 40 [Polypterus senegalus]
MAEMTCPSEDKELQEQLREASAIGNIDEVQTLVERGVDVNSQNEINGWTCLHWACKRNHRQIVSYLLNAGADKEILTAKGERAAQLTSKPDIRKLLGVEENEIIEAKEAELPITANYLTFPQFPYAVSGKSAPASSAQGRCYTESNGALEAVHDEGPTIFPAIKEANVHNNTVAHNGESHVHAAEHNGAPPQSAVTAVAPEAVLPSHGEYRTQNGLVCTPLLSPSASGGPPVPPTRQQSIPQQLHSAQVGAMPAFQPFFFTGAFPMNMQELVLKVRIQNPALKENDFIEVELDRQELTYRSLLRVCCRELQVSTDHVQKIRKLPNTILRKDKDVARLQDFQELELVLDKSENLSLLANAGQATLTEKPCYNMKASKLTY